MQLAIYVDCNEGEESIWISEITQPEFEMLQDLFQKVCDNDGYFPTGSFMADSMMTVEELYGNCKGYSIINKFLPTPVHGFKRISEVKLLQDISNLII